MIRASFELSGGSRVVAHRSDQSWPRRSTYLRWTPLGRVALAAPQWRDVDHPIAPFLRRGSPRQPIEMSDSIPPLPDEDHRCPSCDMRYASLSMPNATAVITAMPADAAAAVAAIDSARLRVRPEPETWSVIEYLCHLRDVAITTTIRLHRARTEDRPALEPMLNDLRARRFRYADADPHATLAELGRIVSGASDEIARISANDWARTVTRLPGEERTMRWLVRHAAHECRHHLADIARVGRGNHRRGDADKPS